MNEPTPIDAILPLPAKDHLNDLPEPNPFYHLIGRKRAYVHKQTAFGRVLVPVGEISTAQDDIAGHAWFDIPKIPAGVLGQAWSFFSAVWDELKTEAMVYLTLRDGEYRIFVPPQECTSGHVTVKDFNPEHIARGWKIAGTIHSHCNFSAFHSGTDTHDADNHDGLHITIGHVDKDSPQFAVMMAFNKVHWDLKLDEVADGVPNKVAHPTWWHRYVKKATYTANYPNTGTMPNQAHWVPPMITAQNPARPYTAYSQPQTKTKTFLSCEGAVAHMVGAGVSLEDTTSDEWADAAKTIDETLDWMAREAMELGIDLAFTIVAEPELITTTPPKRIHEYTNDEWIAAYHKGLLD